MNYSGSPSASLGRRQTIKRLKMGLLMAALLLAIWGCNNTPAPDQVEVAGAPEVEKQAVAQADTGQAGSASPAEPQNDAAAPPAETKAETNHQKMNVAESLLPDARHVEGDPEAPITIIEFSDFKCPYCAQFANESLHWIREYYVKTGKARLAFRHIATLGPESVRAAEASECAAEQDKFWAYHDLLFTDQYSKGSELNDERLLALAVEAGVEMTAFKDCLTSGRYTEQIKLQTEEAQTLGVQATPGFIINSSMLIGAQSYDVFAKAVNKELEKAGWEAPAEQAAAGEVDEIEGLVVYPPDSPPAELLNGTWQNCGIYEEELPIDNVLSSLVHGAVWIAYRPDLPAEQVKVLRDLVSQSQGEEPMVILSPGPYKDKQIVASAWRVQLVLEDASDPRLKQFLEKYQVGPFTPEPGQPCSGGVGTPIS